MSDRSFQEIGISLRLLSGQAKEHSWRGEADVKRLDIPDATSHCGRMTKGSVNRIVKICGERYMLEKAYVDVMLRDGLVLHNHHGLV